MSSDAAGGRRSAATGKPFDATTKQLVEMGPEDWLHYLGLPSAPAEVIDADLATVTAAADRVIRVEGAEPYVVHIEFESGRDARWMAHRLFRYNALIDGLLDLPVYSVVVLLNPNASRHVDLTGLYERALPNHGRYITFKQEG